MYIIKQRISLLAALFAVFAIPAFSQINTYSPYTRFGLGDISRDGFTQNFSMGGTGIAIQDKNSLNYMNPAAYAARDSMSVLLDFGMNVAYNQYLTSTQQKDWWNGSFHHIALSLPVGKYLAIGTGLVPFSSVGYNIKQEYNELGTGDAIDFYYTGDGGVMKYFLGMSGTLFNRISIGSNMNVLIGDITRQRIMTFPRNRGFAETQAVDEISLQHVYFGFGIQYKEVFSDKFFFTLGATYDMQTDLNSAFNTSVRNIFKGNIGTINDSVPLSNAYELISEESNKAIVLPAKIGVGVAMGIPGKLTLTGDYITQNWAEVNNTFDVDGFDLALSRSISGGIEYIPDFEAFRGYHNLISYRLGGYAHDSYVKVGEEQIKNYGITFGVGLPMGRAGSSLNIGFDLGTRGTTENNLIKENYGILTFSVTLHDLWFYKRKYD
ncbi:hypothetical protein ACFLT1_06660 [Bacteroidota bacterium]